MRRIATRRTGALVDLPYAPPRVELIGPNKRPVPPRTKRLRAPDQKMMDQLLERLIERKTARG